MYQNDDPQIQFLKINFGTILTFNFSGVLLHVFIWRSKCSNRGLRLSRTEWCSDGVV